MGRIERGWALTGQAWGILKQDKQLLMFPILSAMALALVLISFFVPLSLLVNFSGLAAHKAGSGPNIMANLAPWHAVVLFVFYFINFFIITFFNSALVACVLSGFNGGPTGVKVGLSIALSRLPQILAWTVLASTVGVVLKMLSERAGLLGQLVLKLVGVAWTIATYFVVPVLVVERAGPVAAVKRSTQMIRDTWGESLTSNVSLSVIFGLLTLLALIPGGAAIAGAIATHHYWLLIPGIAISVLCVMALSVISSTLRMILLAAVYQYASAGTIPAGFDADVLRSAFTPKKN